MKTLVLAEKPSVGRELARILGCNQNGNGLISGERYVVTWALGHLVTLATPEEINRDWQDWKLETLPMIPDRYETSVIKNTSKQFGIVKNLLKDANIKELVIATDAGREGELVARWIINKVGFRKPMYRLWISSMTDQAIMDGFHNLKPASAYENLFKSAEARAIADWVIGLNVTRALTCKYNAQLSAGRVQTPTLAMIIEREKEIKNFIPKDYYQVLLKFRKITFTYQDKNNNQRIDQKEFAENVLNSCKNQNAFIYKIDGNKKFEAPPLLYDLTELQRDANRLYGMSAKRTLDVIQKLYEVEKVLTYPRTDSRYLTVDMISTIPSRLKSINFGNYDSIAQQLLKLPIKQNKRIFNNEKVSDHHAIIPTEQKANISSFSLEEKRIYELVVKRFLSVFLDDFEYIQTIVQAKAKDHLFVARGKTVLRNGWRAVVDKVINDQEEEEDQDQSLPPFTLGETLPNPKFELKAGKTTPPPRYTEATLLSAMEHAGRFVENQKLKDVLEKASGIGTPATRADIIEKLFSVGYMELKGRTIYPTMKGEQLINLVPNELKSPALTANWEVRLERISEGKEINTKFIKDMEENAKNLVDEVKRQEQKYKHENATLSKCPNCGKPLLEINTKVGKALVCSDRSCGYRKNISLNSNLRCPNCHKKLVIIGSGDKKSYTCQCGFKEKCESFHQKLNENKKDMNKRQIENYLRHQKQEIPKNNPFASLLSDVNNRKN